MRTGNCWLGVEARCANRNYRFKHECALCGDNAARVLRPQGQAAPSLGGSVVEDAVERRACSGLRCPKPCQRLPAALRQKAYSTNAAPMPRWLPRGWPAGRGRLSGAQDPARSDEPGRSSGRRRPSRARRASCGPPRVSSGYAACLRRSTTRGAAPSTAAAHGCGCP